VNAWPEPVERVAAVLRAAKIEARVEELRGGTASAEAAAAAAGCKLEQIVKSLVVVADGRTALALVPGNRRADTAKLARALGASNAHIAGPDQVRELTGFDPGAVAPFPLPRIDRVLLDRALLTQPLLWIGAGSATHLAALRPIDLIRLTGAVTVDAAERHG
jgi:prolyl-tRNA editing enzyme YbaK/EbsC (Cys-tRNA(Pro) deacylase)